MKMWLANGYKMDVGKVLRTVPKNGYSLELKLDDRFNLLGIRLLKDFICKILPKEMRIMNPFPK